MVGGYFRGGACCCARRVEAALLATTLWTLLGTGLVHAESDVAGEDCARKATPEQSIVVSNAKSTGNEQATSSTANLDNELEPIAVVSEYEPDLADPIANQAVPDLAEPISSRGMHALRGKSMVRRLSSSTGENSTEALPATEVLNFHKITPGISTRIDVLHTWGDPRNEETTAQELDYRFDKLEAVHVQFDGDVVDAVVVELPRPLSAEKLVSKLGMLAIRPTTLTDSAGTPVAQVYPERGVVLRVSSEDRASIVSDLAGTPTSEISYSVDRIIIQPIKAAAFLLRAENEMRRDLSHSIQDLKQALQFDHDSAHAKWLLSDLSLQIGKAVTAERYAAEAVELDPHNNVYRLQHAKCLRKLARYDIAADQVRMVLESPAIDAIVRAQALEEMGLLASLGSSTVAERAVPLINKAIEIADGLATHEDTKIRMAAKKLLVDTHLDMAVLISRGEWDQKDQTVPQWIERASALSEELILNDNQHLPLRLEVAINALTTSAHLDPPVAPELWIEEAEQTVAELRNLTDDPLLRDVYDWNLGLAYFQAAQIEHRRSEPDSALELCALAEENLAALAKDRDELPDTAYLMGRLYFQIGAVHAVHFDDHTEACQWYDRAADRLINPVPVTTMAGPQQHGDALVSMGVSYWHAGSRERAVELTQLGVDLIEQAVESGLLTKESLGVPYGNLAAMYEAQGQSEPAEKYTRLAKKIADGEKSLQRR